MKNVLFICGKAKQRSPTAEQIFADEFNTDSAGLSNDADVPLSTEQIEWATHLVVMEKSQVTRLRRKFGKYVSGKKIVCLDIQDNYEFMQPELVAMLQSRIARLQ